MNPILLQLLLRHGLTLLGGVMTAHGYHVGQAETDALAGAAEAAVGAVTTIAGVAMSVREKKKR